MPFFLERHDWVNTYSDHQPVVNGLALVKWGEQTAWLLNIRTVQTTFWKVQRLCRQKFPWNIIIVVWQAVFCHFRSLKWLFLFSICVESCIFTHEATKSAYLVSSVVQRYVQSIVLIRSYRTKIELYALINHGFLRDTLLNSDLFFKK